MKHLPTWPFYLIIFLVGISLGFALRSLLIGDGSVVAASVSALASLIVAAVTYEYVRLTSRYVATNEQSLALMREQWNSQREARPAFWLERGQEGTAEFDIDRRRLVFGRVFVKVWNFGQHSFKITGGTVNRSGQDGAQFRRRLSNPELVIRPDDAQSWDVSYALLKAVTGTAADDMTLVRMPETCDVEIVLTFTSAEGENIETRDELFALDFNPINGNLNSIVRRPPTS